MLGKGLNCFIINKLTLWYPQLHTKGVIRISAIYPILIKYMNRLIELKKDYNYLLDLITI